MTDLVRTPLRSLVDSAHVDEDTGIDEMFNRRKVSALTRRQISKTLHRQRAKLSRLHSKPAVLRLAAKTHKINVSRHKTTVGGRVVHQGAEANKAHKILNVGQKKAHTGKYSLWASHAADFSTKIEAYEALVGYLTEGV